jgi:hypothetical protein
MANARSSEVKTPECRGSFVHLLEREKKPDGSEGMYSMIMLFPKKSNDWRADLPWLAKAVDECLAAQYPDQSKMPPVFKANTTGKPFPVKDGDAPNGMGKVQEHHKGNWCVRAASSMFNPAVNLLDGVTKTLGQMPPATCYSGCYFQVIGNVYLYNTSGNLGLSFGMNNVMKSRDGESLAGGGGSNAADAFGVAPEASSAASAFAV